MPIVFRSVILILGVLAFARAVEPAIRSPVALAADAAGGTVYVAEATTNQIAEVDLTGRRVVREFPLPDGPTAVVLSPDGRQIYVAAGVAQGRIHRIERDSGKISRSYPVGHTPTALVPTADGARMFVCARFNDQVEVLDLVGGTVTARIPVEREPVALGLTPDGSRLVVANHLPAGRADVETVAAGISFIDTAKNQVIATVHLPNGSTSLRGLALSPDGAFAYVTHILGRYQQPTTQLERGWMNTNALSIIDVRGMKLTATVLLDSVDQGAANPWGVACSADGAWVAVSHAGSHEVSLIDRVALHRALATPKGANAADDLAFLTGMQRRLAVPGKGPRGLTIAGNRVVTTEYFTDTLAVIDLTTPAASGISLGPLAESSIVRKGELAFNDASRCFQRWQSCASCHPDSRTDGLNWDLMNDGLGNPKNTRNMLNAHRRSPVMALGIRESAEKAVRAGFRYIQFAVVDEEVTTSVDEYLKSLTPVPSPHLVDGKLSPQAERGQALFTSTGCIACHKPPLFTDMKKHEFGFGTGIDAGKPFMTPTLVEIWRTAPYLHDGRAATLKDVLTTADPEGRHGDAKNLSAKDLDDLLEFVLSL